MTAALADEQRSRAEAVLPDTRLGHHDGLLKLELRRDAAGRTGIHRLQQRFPLRMTVPFYLDPADPGMAFIYSQNPTGGVFQGDRLTTDVDLAPAAQAHLTTQSATKVFAMDGDDALADYRLRLSEGAYLEHIPDLLIPHRTARLRQNITVDMAPTSIYVGTEVIAPGRLAHGEEFEYDALHLTTTVRCGGRKLCVDAVRLEPYRHDVRRSGMMSDYSYLVSVLVAAPAHDADSTAAHLNAVAEMFEAARVVGAAGVLPNGVGVSARALARDPQSAQAAAMSYWREARQLLLGRPLPRIRK